jgi:rod shape-determining protein MreC
LKRRAKKKNIWLVALAVAAALVMALMSHLSGNEASILEKAVKGFYYPAERAAARAAEAIGDLRDYISMVDELKEENTELKMEIAKLKLELRQAEAAVKENESLKTLLKLTQTMTQFNYAAADVISGSSSSFSSDFTIGSGSSAGLEVGMCVVSWDGHLIGSITSLGSEWATVTTILDPTSRISAVIDETNDVGIAGGDYAYMSSGKLIIRYLQSDAALRSGNTVTTTGTGGKYPPGLIVGYIEKIIPDPSGLSYSAVLRPAADLDDLTQVFIIVSNADKQ